MTETTRQSNGYRKPDDEVAGPVIAGAILLGLFAFGIHSAETARAEYQKANQSRSGKPLTHTLTAAELEAINRFRTALKDPAVAEKLAEKLKAASPEIKEILDDPEALQTLKKLANAIGPASESLDQTLEHLREKKELLEDTNPGKWTEKAKVEAGAPIPNR